MKNEITNIRGREKITREFYINLRDSSEIDFVVYDRRKYKIVFEGQGGYIQSSSQNQFSHINKSFQNNFHDQKLG